MIALSHRGFWKTADEQNQPSAFRRSFDLGFGIETDIRDYKGRLVISHDMPTGDEPTFLEMLRLLSSRNLPIAINIKADGLAKSLAEEMKGRSLTRWFTFDMSIPEMLKQLDLGLPVFTRASEYERIPACYDRSKGIWLDDFGANWYKMNDIRAILADGKQVCIVSSELHGRDHREQWQILRRDGLGCAPGLMLCTDIPDEAEQFFGTIQ